MGFVHGGNIIATATELGLQVDELIDMSSNLSPLGMVPGLRRVLGEGLEQIAYLPEATSQSLCALFARCMGCAPEQVMAGNGTTDFIYDLPARSPFNRAVIVNPTYSDYRLACQYSGLSWHDFGTCFPDFSVDLAALGRALPGGELVFLCNPNNPTGHLVASRRLRAFVEDHPRTTFIVDESYLPFCREPSLVAADLPDNLYILCSSSKIYGIPGLRLGFLVSTPANMADLRAHCRPWSVNRLAQIAGEYLLSEADGYVRQVQEFMAQERPAFAARLAELPGISVVPGVTNFILCRLRDRDADQLAAHMLSHRIMIRNCASFDGLDNSYFRVSMKSSADNRYFLATLTSFLSTPLNKP